MLPMIHCACVLQGCTSCYSLLQQHAGISYSFVASSFAALLLNGSAMAFTPVQQRQQQQQKPHSLLKKRISLSSV